MKLSNRLILIIGTIILTSLLSHFIHNYQTVSQASNQPNPTPQALSDYMHLLSGTSNDLVVKLHFADREHLGRVAGVLDIWEVNKENGYAIAAISPEQYQWLDILGYQLEIDPGKTAQIQTPMAPLDPRFYYFDDYYPNSNGLYVLDFLINTNTIYPGLTELIDIGDAWLANLTGEYDRDIWVLRITNEDTINYGEIPEKPVFFLLADIHAREVTTPELAIRYIKYLTAGYDGEGGYGIDPDVTWLVNHNVLYVLIMENPDGHWVDEQDTSANRRKNLDNDDGCGDPSNWGVDLNRNSSFLWGCCGGSSGNPCDVTYRGPSAGSEPETQAFQSYFESIIVDQNGSNGDDEIPMASALDTTGIFISLHSYSDLVLWPWGFDDFGDSPNFPELQTIGRKFAYFNDYDASGQIWYDVDGATDDWTYGKFGIASFTFEVGPSSGSCGGFFPAYECIDGAPGYSENFWAENKPALLYAHKIAHSPYMTAYGPDTQDLYALPEEAFLGQTVQLTSIIQDHRYGSDLLAPIHGAEYFIDAPGEDGTGIPLLPTDDSWGDLIEEVTASLNTSDLDAGKHYILVHGKNDNGDWGPFSAVFLTISIPDYWFVLYPDSELKQANAGQVVIYTLHIENLGINSDTYDLSANSDWSVSMPEIVGPLIPGEASEVELSVFVPEGAVPGEINTTHVIVASQNDPQITAEIFLTTSVPEYLVYLPVTFAP